ncbi:MAG TPA: Ada metal-binding domain-containing protein [Cyclobacteriaceae bacterium]
MLKHETISNSELRKLIQSGKIRLGGNAKLKIYGTLHCASGKRMKKQNRVFFASEKEAKVNGYRPCGHCLREKYLRWIENNHAGPVSASSDSTNKGRTKNKNS